MAITQKCPFTLHVHPSRVWDLLPGGGGMRWVELTGPADPLLIRGAVVVPGSGSGSDQAGGSGSGDSVLILLEASARLPGAEGLTGVEVRRGRSLRFQSSGVWQNGWICLGNINRGRWGVYNKRNFGISTHGATAFNLNLFPPRNVLHLPPLLGQRAHLGPRGG